MVRRWMTGLRLGNLSARVVERAEAVAAERTEEQPGINSASFSIRRAVPRDVRVLAGLWREMMDFHQRIDPAFEFGAGAQAGIERHLAETIRSNGGRIFVADIGDRIVGYVLGEIQERKPIYPSGRYGFISDLAVTEEWRRRGVGRALVTSLLSWFGEHGVTAIELFVLETNPVSTVFWESMGFRHYLRLLRRSTSQTGPGGAT